MKWSKTIGVMIFAGLAAQFAVAQSQEAPLLPAEKPDPFKLIQLYPNPAVEYLVVHFAEPHPQSVKLTIHSITGNTVEVERETVDEHEIRLRVKDLPSGYYFLSVKDDTANQRGSFKFLKR
jgi:hypothetical protein